GMIIDRLALAGLYSLIVIQIMPRVHAVKGRPRMQDAATLRIKLGKKMIEIRVETTFIAIVPEHNGRMVHVSRHHFVYELRPDRVVVEMMPAAQFIQNVKAKFIAEIEKLFIRRIMRHADGVHVRVLHRFDVEAMDGLAQATARLRPKGMA